jgi:hypothetical protein
MSPDRLRRAALVTVACMLFGACGESVAFVRDDRITIEFPTSLERVRAPFEIRWSDEEQPPAAYAVFVDRDPIGPGESLRELAEDACDGRSGCDTPAFYASRRIHVTTEPRVEVATLTPLGGTGGRSKHRVHHATIVLLDDDGRREGEASWSVEFREADA